MNPNSATAPIPNSLNSPPRQEYVVEFGDNEKNILGKLFKYSLIVLILSFASIISKGVQKSFCPKIMEDKLIPTTGIGLNIFDGFLIWYFFAYNALVCMIGLTKLLIKIYTGLFFSLLMIRFCLGIGYIKQSNDFIVDWQNQKGLLNHSESYYDSFESDITLDEYRFSAAAYLFKYVITFQCLIFLILTIVLLIRIFRS